MAVLTLEKPTTTTEELIEKLYRTEGKAEIVNGEIVEMPPTGYEPGIASHTITTELRKYGRKTNLGFGVPDNVAFKVTLPNRKSFSPDAAFHTGEKTGMKFLEGAPIFAVEVRSENDYGSQAEKAIAEKRADYFAAGTEIVWDVDLLSDEVIKSFHGDNPDNPKVFRRGDVANAEPVLPKWKMAVNELFD
ncbi:hypothetical protein BH18ACI1_BH18ACI1_09160 [soil metagenome]